MKRLLIPTTGPCQWRALLADPGKHWKRGRSALEAAVSWETAQQDRDGRGLPVEVADLLDQEENLKGSQIILGIPEHKVTLDTARAPSQNDLWALLRNDRGLISLSVEAKAGESFDKTVDQWLNQNTNTAGREARLRWLAEALHGSVELEGLGALRYQLFHRTASALKEAHRCGAFAAVMLVQAFPGAEESFSDFSQFADYLGVAVEPERLAKVPSHDSPKLSIGWVSSPVASDQQIAQLLSANL